MLRTGTCTLLIACLSAAIVRADDIDTENARKHFRVGTELYTQEHYVEALVEFKRALIAKPLPALHYNIAKCHDHLEQYIEAIAAYEAYLAAGPEEVDVADVRTRIASLRIMLNRTKQLNDSGPTKEKEGPGLTMVPSVATHPPDRASSPTVHTRARLLPWIFGGTTVALFAAGIVSEVVAQVRYNDAKASACGGPGTCGDEIIDAIALPETLGYVLLSVAGAAAVATAVSLILEKHAAPKSVRVGTRTGSMVVRF